MVGKRSDTIKRKHSICSTHGTTDFAAYGTGRNGLVVWKCMECEKVRSAAYYKDVREGKRTKTKRVYDVEPKTGAVCEKCFMTKPLSGVCDNCE